MIGWVLVLGLHAQIVENMRIYTDKDCYVAGEDLCIKVCVTDSLSRGSVLSKVAYVETVSYTHLDVYKRQLRSSLTECLRRGRTGRR